MNTPTEYRGFAVECLKSAGETTDASQRRTFMNLARLWMDAAFRLDQGAAVAPDQSELLRQLRAKLD